MDLNTFLRTQRKIKKISTTELGKQTGIAISTISRYEHGKAPIQSNKLENIFDFIGFRLIPVPKELLNQ